MKAPKTKARQCFLAALCLSAAALAHAADIIVDSAASSSVVEKIGAWTTASVAGSPYGGSYLHDGNAGQGTKSVRFMPDFPQSGFYEVFARWTSGQNRATNAPWTVISATGNHQYPVNQEKNGDTWYSLGIHGFNKDARDGVIVSNEGADEYVIVDAVKFVPVAAPLWEPKHLGDQIWQDWWASDLAGLANGAAVGTWTSRDGDVSATQSDSAKKPVKQLNQVVFTGLDKLAYPAQQNAYQTHRGLMLLFRVDLTGEGNGFIFAVNGAGGGERERQPAVTYNRNNDTVSVIWKTLGGSNAITFSNVSPDKTKWHCLVARRVGTENGPVLYASLDGKKADGATYGESSVTMTDWGVSQTTFGGAADSFLGFASGSNPEMAIDTLFVLQDELSKADAEKLMGWAMWRRGVQTSLPSSHPYRNARPVASVPAYAFDEMTIGEWNSLNAYLADGNRAVSEAHRGTLVNTSGWQMVFNDEFNSHSITHQERGRGKWFAPAHPKATGVAKGVVPPYNSSNPALGAAGSPATYLLNDQGQTGTMTLVMQGTTGSPSTWTSGAFASVNSNGYGNAWMFPYIKVRAKMGPSSSTNLKGAWPAFWVKSINSFFNYKESNLEYDFYEGYGTFTNGYYNVFHAWEAVRPRPGRIQNDRSKTHVLQLHTGTASWDNKPRWYQNVNLFDGQYHTYGLMVTPTTTYVYFDDREIQRFPTPVDMRQPLFFLADLALNDDGNEEFEASGVYKLTIDYVRIYQNPSYPGYSP